MQNFIAVRMKLWTWEWFSDPQPMDEADPVGLTHWGRMTYICVSKLTIIGSDNGLSPGQCQAIIWTNAGILLIQTFNEISSDIHTISFIQENVFENVICEEAAILSQPQCISRGGGVGWWQAYMLAPSASWYCCQIRLVVDMYIGVIAQQPL